MQMNTKKAKGLLKSSIILLDLMTGEDKMNYLERMWNLYFKVYEKKSIRVIKNKINLVEFYKSKEYQEK